MAQPPVLEHQAPIQGIVEPAPIHGALELETQTSRRDFRTTTQFVFAIVCRWLVFAIRRQTDEQGIQTSHRIRWKLVIGGVMLITILGVLGGLGLLRDPRPPRPTDEDPGRGAPLPAPLTGARCAPGQSPTLYPAFLALKGALDWIVGEPVNCAYPNPQNNDIVQDTVLLRGDGERQWGQLCLRHATGVISYTHGHRHWAILPGGRRVEWEGKSTDPPILGMTHDQ